MADPKAPAAMVCDGNVCRVPDSPFPSVSSANTPPTSELPFLRQLTSLVDSDTWQAVDTNHALTSKKFVLLYFSAGWCPPCRAFSQILSPWAKQHADDVAVVFVSHDRSEQDMIDYVSHKGFLCVPYADRARQELPQMLRIAMLPTLVVLDAKTGQYVTDWGVSAIRKNPDACISDWQRGAAGVSWWQLLRPW
jgi:thiol-disulfide isomerase/thioredoxin